MWKLLVDCIDATNDPANGTMDYPSAYKLSLIN